MTGLCTLTALSWTGDLPLPGHVVKAENGREEKMFGLQRALHRMVEPPTDLDIVVFEYHANDNRRAPR